MSSRGRGERGPRAPSGPDRALTRLERTRLRHRRRRATLAAAGLGALVLAAGAVGVAVIYTSGGHSADATTSGAAGRGVDAAAVHRAGAAGFTDPAAAAAAMTAARSAVQVVDSYDYRSLDDALASAVAVSTGPFRARVQDSFAGSLRSAATQLRTVQVCHVLAVGLRGMNEDGTAADLLVFAALAVTDTRSPAEPRSSPLTLSVSMSRIGDEWLLSEMTDLSAAPAPDAPAPGSAGLAAAVQTAAQGAVDLLSFRRESFDSDFRRALDGLTDELAAQQRANEQEIRTAMTNGRFDLTAQSLAAAAEQADGDTASVLVAVRAYRDPDSGPPQLAAQGRYRVELIRQDERWLLANIAPIDGG